MSGEHSGQDGGGQTRWTKSRDTKRDRGLVMANVERLRGLRKQIGYEGREQKGREEGQGGLGRNKEVWERLGKGCHSERRVR